MSPIILSHPFCLLPSKLVQKYFKKIGYIFREGCLTPFLGQDEEEKTAPSKLIISQLRFAVVTFNYPSKLWTADEESQFHSADSSKRNPTHLNHIFTILHF